VGDCRWHEIAAGWVDGARTRRDTEHEPVEVVNMGPFEKDPSSPTLDPPTLLALPQKMKPTTAKCTRGNVLATKEALILLDHHFCRLDHSCHGIALFELQLFCAAPGDDALDKVRPHAHNHVCH
jgi:hypothetical protein